VPTRLHAQGQSPGEGTLKASASSRRIVLGEPFTLTLQTSFPRKNPPPALPVFPDSIPHFELLEPVRTDSSGTADILTVTHTYTLTSFDSGHWVIPAVSMKLGKKPVFSDSLGIDVQTIPLQGNAYRDIHEIVEVEAKPINWKLWAGIGISALLLALGIWNYLRHRKKPRPQPLPFDSKLSPFDQAMQSLRSIREARHLDRGDARTHYTGMTDALRIFLVRKFSIPVMAETTGDILLRMQDGKLDRDQLSALATCLRLSDAVKFAKYPSDPPEAAKALDDMEAVIRALNQQNAND
jgi:BatD DUF11 like domain